MKEITVGVADCRISDNPGSVLVTHALGSCVAVAIHDPVSGVAGMAHIMLPESSIDRAKAASRPYQFADTGIPLLFHAAYALGAEKRRITARLVGGAQILDPEGVFNVGKRNHLACRKILWAAGVIVQGEAVGGSISRTAYLEPASGRLWWTTPGGAPREIPASKGVVRAPAGERLCAREAAREGGLG